MTLRLLRIPGAMLTAALLLGAPMVLGWGIAMSDGFEQSFGSALLFAGAAAACSVIILTGPIGCLIAVSAVQIVGFVPVLMRVGKVDFTLSDVFYVGLVVWWMTQWAHRRRHREQRREAAFGERAVLVFLAYVGVTTVSVLLLDPEQFATSSISWIRLVQTASLAWLAASVIRTERELRLLVNALAAAAAASVLLAVGEGLLSRESLSERYGGLLGPNALGLVSGLLIVFAVANAAGGRMSHRAALGLIGVSGLAASKSQGALIATAVVVVVALATTGRSARPGVARTRSAAQHLNRVLLGVACAGVLVGAGIQFLRPVSIHDFHQSSVYARIIVGTGGLEIFSQHPFFGVGWRRSSSPEVIASEDLAAKLRRRFSTSDETFFPDVQVTSVHNTYIQLLAELGLVGVALFGVAVWAVGRRMRGLLRNLPRGSESWRQARFLTFAALLSLVWLNDNPLYGGQPETVLLAVALGSLVALARLRPTEAGELVAVGQAPRVMATEHPFSVRTRGHTTDRPAAVEASEDPSRGRMFPPHEAAHPSGPLPGRGEGPSSRLEIAELEAESSEALRRLVTEVELGIDSLREKLREPSSSAEHQEVAAPLEGGRTHPAEKRALDQETTSSEPGVKRRRGLFRRHGPGR
jgi:O-antigen ligase